MVPETSKTKEDIMSTQGVDTNVSGITSLPLYKDLRHHPFPLTSVEGDGPIRILSFPHLSVMYVTSPETGPSFLLFDERGWHGGRVSHLERDKIRSQRGEEVPSQKVDSRRDKDRDRGRERVFQRTEEN